jgi:hypothetical protein
VLILNRVKRITNEKGECLALKNSAKANVFTVASAAKVMGVFEIH